MDRRKRAVKDLSRDIANLPEPKEFFGEVAARVWGYFEGDVNTSPVCRHVVCEVLNEAAQRGLEAVADWWATTDEGIFHTTPAVKFGDSWWSFEVELTDKGYVGHSREVRPHSSVEFPASLTLTRSGHPDVKWYRNLPGGRNLTKWLGLVPDNLLQVWNREYFEHRMRHNRELRTGEADRKDRERLA